MRRWKVASWSAALLLAAGTAATFAEDDTQERKPVPTYAQRRSGSVLNSLGRAFGPKEEAGDLEEPLIPLRKSTGKAGEGSAEAKAGKVDPALEKAARERRRHEQTLFRRQAVCLKLMQIAAETNDQELQRLAEELDRQAFEAYQSQTERLPAGAALVQSGVEDVKDELASGPGKEDGSTSGSRRGKERTARTVAQEGKP